jgi:hypothetical protein
MKISPQLIEHKNFHKGIWLLSLSRPRWYYFMKKSRPAKITNRNFLQSVDKPLRELVKFLHSKKIKTTPSCSGHHKSKKVFEKIYETLKDDTRYIRNEGLKLRDIESGRLFLYRNKNYVLPWNKKRFLQKVIPYQKNGIIGIIAGNKLKVKRKILELKIEGAKIYEKDAIVFIYTNGGDTGIWKKITSEVKKCFDTRTPKAKSQSKLQLQYKN